MALVLWEIHTSQPSWSFSIASSPCPWESLEKADIWFTRLAASQRKWKVGTFCLQSSKPLLGLSLHHPPTPTPITQFQRMEQGALLLSSFSLSLVLLPHPSVVQHILTGAVGLAPTLSSRTVFGVNFDFWYSKGWGFCKLWTLNF